MGGKKGKAAEESEELPFDATLDPKWAAKVDSWMWKSRTGTRAIKTGPCQRCGHQISVLDRTDVIAQMAMAGRPGATEARKHATCNCGVKHPETPEGESGCGGHGLIERPHRQTSGEAGR